MPAKRHAAAIAKAYQAASRCASIAMGMVIPGFLGYWLDAWPGISPWLTFAGFALGFAYGVWRLALLGQPPALRSAAKEKSAGAKAAGERNINDPQGGPPADSLPPS